MRTIIFNQFYQLLIACGFEVIWPTSNDRNTVIVVERTPFPEGYRHPETILNQHYFTFESSQIDHYNRANENTIYREFSNIGKWSFGEIDAFNKWRKKRQLYLPQQFDHALKELDLGLADLFEPTGDIAGILIYPDMAYIIVLDNASAKDNGGRYFTMIDRSDPRSDNLEEIEMTLYTYIQENP